MIKGTFFKSDQEFFNAAWKWLIINKNPSCLNDSLSGPLCLYRKINEHVTTTCVIGAFIPDELLPLGQRTYGRIETLIIQNPKVSEWFKNVRIEILGRVQRIHDAYNYNAMIVRVAEMKMIAERYNLKIPDETTGLPYKIEP